MYLHLLCARPEHWVGKKKCLDPQHCLERLFLHQFCFYMPLPKTGKGPGLNHLDKKLCCKQAVTATEFPTCHSTADEEPEVDMCPAAASASPELRDSLCQNPSAAFAFEFVQWGWAGKRGHLLSDGQPSLQVAVSPGIPLSPVFPKSPPEWVLLSTEYLH